MTDLAPRPTRLPLFAYGTLVDGDFVARRFDGRARVAGEVAGRTVLAQVYVPTERTLRRLGAIGEGSGPGF